MDVLNLWQVENELRARVERSPSNAEARRDLACCLVLLAMYQAGYEDNGGAGHAYLGEEHNGTPDNSRSSSELFREHLWHLHVLKMLPSHKEGAASDYINVPSVIGMLPLTMEVKGKYETAFRRFLADLQSPDQDATTDRI